MPSTSPAAQDYLKGLWHLEHESASEALVSTNAIARRLDVSAASATNMLKKLGAMGLVVHHSYRGAALTEAGRKVALEVIRHHRLLETYLAQALGVPWDEVHDEAEVLEHVLSEDLEDRISSRLGNPAVDPHGHPIPTKEGAIQSAPGRALWEVSDGERVVVDRVSDEEADVLRYLDEVGLRPGAKLEVIGRGPVGGPLFIRLSGEMEPTQALSRELAEAIWVE
ncbi:MAG: metal-dependent transcriptional regulator [Actinomycetota bacterium]|nr:metal-dependent transcriptional regulator [Actinomycetota bacterium]